MSVIANILPPFDVAVEMEPEMLAVHVLECLCIFEEVGDVRMLNRYNFTLDQTFKGYCESSQYLTIAKAVTEAWIWLQREGLIAPEPFQTGEWVFVTRRGKKLRESADVRKFMITSLLPANTLDPRLALKVRPPFLRGDYDSAIHEAFKEVEHTVRTCAGLTAEFYGLTLMKEAFEPAHGVLAEKDKPLAEQQAVMDLFSGAVGSFKNDCNLRDVQIEDAVEVVELIMLANLLIRIARRRAQRVQVSDRVIE